MRQSTEAERLYAAGFFDGEGCIHLGYRETYRTRKGQLLTGHFVGRLRLTQTQFDVLRWFEAIWGGRVALTSPNRSYENRQPSWGWNTERLREIRRFLQEVGPHLKVKTPQAALMMQWLAMAPTLRCHHAGAIKEAMNNLNARGGTALERKGLPMPVVEPSPQLRLLEDA